MLMEVFPFPCINHTHLQFLIKNRTVVGQHVRKKSPAQMTLVSLAGRQHLGRLVVTPYSCHYYKFGVLCEKVNPIVLKPNCFKSLHNFLPHLPVVFLGPHDLVCLLMFSNKPQRPSLNSWTYTEIKLQTSGCLLQ
ncbi:hypothetical protein XENOCAPTIV_022404 [Xenoophorus captivus]|uniref:Uncharacterized protein n=1 Tax=Xenoophorus captivus TaxID=1517983 RepID=A0ABV0RAN3_9TELE